MTKLLTTLALLGLAFAGDVAIAGPPSGHYCNMGVFTPASLKRHTALVEKLVAAKISVRELDNGYAITFAGSLNEIGEWLDGVRRCCPTLDYRLELPKGNRDFTLYATGDAGAKEFIREEFAAVLGHK